MIDITKRRKQLIKDVKEGAQESGNFFIKQPKETLWAIVQSFEGEAIFETDEDEKKKLYEMAELAKSWIILN